MTPLHATVAIVGAGDYIGSEIAKRFAREGYLIVAGRRNGDKLAPLVAEVEADGGRIVGRPLDARVPEQVVAFLEAAEAEAPLALVVFNVGGNVNFPILETTDRVFRKVWEMCCFAGFLAGREAARLMLARPSQRAVDGEGEAGKIFFTGATASLRGASGFAAFAAGKAGMRAMAQSMARELWPKGIHVAHLVIDAGVDTQWVRERLAVREGQGALEALPPDRLMPPSAVAEAYWQLFRQPRAAWTFEQEIRPYAEPW